jgi:hypothetical protein
MDSLAGYLEVPGYGEMFTAARFGEAVQAAGAGATHAELLDALPPDAASRMGLVGDLDTVRASGRLRRGRTRRGGARAGHRGRPGWRTHPDRARLVPLVGPAGSLPGIEVPGFGSFGLLVDDEPVWWPRPSQICCRHVDPGFCTMVLVNGLGLMPVWPHRAPAGW